MSSLTDHPQRYALANELHARPFPHVDSPCQATFLAIKQPQDAANRDRDQDRAHLLALLDRHGAAHPAPGATHYFGDLGRYRLKWESHTEFVTYTLFGAVPEGPPFDPHGFGAFPEDWLAEAPGVRITSAMMRIEPMPDAQETIVERLDSWFVGESLAVSCVIDESAVVATDYHIDPAGHMRLAVFLAPETGPQRAGRVVQRLFEIETYKSLALLAVPRARALGATLGDMDRQLSNLVGAMREGDAQTETTLDGLLQIASELETMLAQSNFRFGARAAYEALVNQRIKILRETRFMGLQTIGEFMMRRFDPAMRTCVAVERRMEVMAERARRAGDLLGTRVNVQRAAQNQTLLESMDQRAALQLRLQRTVEGFSVVAISYYAVNLVSYLIFPVAAEFGWSKELVTGMTVLPVLSIVWYVIHRIRKSMDKTSS